MSNASLKEQLQSLGLSSAASEKKPQQHHKNKHPQTDKSDKKGKPAQTKAKAQKPAWLEQAQYGVELLKAHFSACFKDLKEIQPLKIGIKQDLVKHLSTREDIVIGDKACMVNSLAYYVNSPSYHKQVVAGAIRIDLEGQPSGIVTAEEAQYSIDCRNAKLQKKKSGANPPANNEAQKSQSSMQASQNNKPEIEKAKIETPQAETAK
ncbi:MAG: ProQ/FINO family protein [Gammaproteobacteria bacterium]